MGQTYIYLTYTDMAMVTHISFAVDDGLAERARGVKDEQGWTWEELFEHAVDEFEHGDE